MKYIDRFREVLINPTWEQIIERDPLIKFSFYLAGRVQVLATTADEIVDQLDNGFAGPCVDGGRVARAESLMWFWTLGAYEVVRTMCQSKGCFSARVSGDLDRLKRKLARVRMPAAKMEKPGQQAPVNSNRSPSGWDVGGRDLLINDPDERPDVSARILLREFDEVFRSITTDDILAHHENSYTVDGS